MDRVKTERVRTVAVDFDGVIHMCRDWSGRELTYEPVELLQTKRELRKLQENGWKIIIWTSRIVTIKVIDWLNSYDIPYDSVNHNPFGPENLADARKIHADVYIDDKAILFNGEWKGMAHKVMNFKTWWRREMEPATTPVEVMSEAADLYRRKSSRDNYNGNEIRFGRVMNQMYPDGLTIKGEEDWIKYGLFHMVIAKALRLSNTIFGEEGDGAVEKRADNAKDSVVYNAMLASVLENEERK